MTDYYNYQVMENTYCNYEVRHFSSDLHRVIQTPNTDILRNEFFEVWFVVANKNSCIEFRTSRQIIVLRICKTHRVVFYNLTKKTGNILYVSIEKPHIYHQAFTF